MKSMLHEASNVVKAIEKAWADAGKPREFTVNVLELGEKGFLGFTKHPAIVSITFDPVRTQAAGKTPDKRDRRNDRSDRNDRGDRRDRSAADGLRSDNRRRDGRPERTERSERQDRSERSERPERSERFDRQDRPERTERTERFDRPERSERQDRGERSERSERFDRPERSERQERGPREPRDRERVRDNYDNGDPVSWTPDLVVDIETELALLVKNADITTPYVLAAEGRQATVNFSASILPDQGDERQLFMSISYLVLQFLKKKHKKKFRGFHITISAGDSQYDSYDAGDDAQE